MTPEIRRELGARRGEVAHIIRYELRRRGHTNKAFADLLGCSAALVSKTIAGFGHSPLVLDGLREVGIPEEYIFDPRRHEARMREAV